MDTKNAAILLLLMLCILGLAIGAYYTEAGESAAEPDGYNEVVYEDTNGTITISLELKEKNETFMDKIFMS